MSAAQLGQHLADPTDRASAENDPRGARAMIERVHLLIVGAVEF